MADVWQDNKSLVATFKSGDILLAEHLLNHVHQPNVVRTTFMWSSLMLRQSVGSASSRVLDVPILTNMVSLLHLAAYRGWEDIARCLVSVHSCSANWKDSKGHFPIHYAAYFGHFKMVKYFITELHCNPMEGNIHGDTPLHYACGHGHLNIAHYLISEARCNPSCTNKYSEAPLHLASLCGSIDVVQYLISEAHCNPSCTTDAGSTLLHNACRRGHLDVTQYLISKVHCNPSCENNRGNTPLHYACREGHFNIVQYLISEVHCNPSCENNRGNTPLHYACREGHFNIVQYLISEVHCNPSCENKDGRGPIHYACSNSHVCIVRYLISTGQVNPMAEDNNGITPLSFAEGDYDIIKLLQPFIDCSRDFPVHTFTKLILTGDSGAGKTTIALHIKHLLAHRGNSDIVCVAGVQPFTAGIIPHHIESELGNFVIYDFAGQQEYYSSHAAVLEQVMCKSAAMFLCMIDLSKSKENISQSLHYWLTFIDNACSSTPMVTSHVVIVGSHVDQVTSEEEIEEKILLLQTMAEQRLKCQENSGCVAIDCRCANTDASHKLIDILTKSRKVITEDQPSISYYCHVLYAFLRTKFSKVGCTLHDLISDIAKEEDSSLPTDQSVLSELLTTLSDKGLILFIKHLQCSWIVVRTETLLTDINGTLFAPGHFKEHRNLASNTGIVPTSNLHEVFPQHNLEMLVNFLVSLDFCRPVDPSVLPYTNLQTTPSHSTADLLFFPGLVQSERPGRFNQGGMLQFGWCLGCLDPNQFFGSRFLYLLLLAVAYQFPLAARRNIVPSLHGLQRRCTVWKNGISWSDSDNITTVVELIDKNRWVLVAMSSSEDRPVEHAKLRSALIIMIRNLQQERCPNLKVCECLISPSLVQQYPLDDLPDTDLFDIQDVAMSILCRKPSIPSQNEDCIGHLPTQSLPLEPYHFISPSSVCQLFNSDMVDQHVPAPLLEQVQKHLSIKKELLYKELREQMDKLSIFAGKNPLVSTYAC